MKTQKIGQFGLMLLNSEISLVKVASVKSTRVSMRKMWPSRFDQGSKWDKQQFLTTLEETKS